MTYEPIVLEKWRSSFLSHRLIVTPRGTLRVEFRIGVDWYNCNADSCIPKFRRTNARK